MIVGYWEDLSQVSCERSLGFEGKWTIMIVRLPIRRCRGLYMGGIQDQTISNWEATMRDFESVYQKVKYPLIYRKGRIAREQGGRFTWVQQLWRWCKTKLFFLVKEVSDLRCFFSLRKYALPFMLRRMNSKLHLLPLKTDIAKTRNRISHDRMLLRANTGWGHGLLIIWIVYSNRYNATSIDYQSPLGDFSEPEDIKDINLSPSNVAFSESSGFLNVSKSLNQVPKFNFPLLSNFRS